MPIGTSDKRTYLHITYGKLRMKTTESDPEAQSRENKDGKTIYERVYSWVEGNLAGIYYKQDDKYGNSFEVIIDDGKDRFQVSFPEGDNYFMDFFSKLPNTDMSKPLRIAPYDFEDSNTGKRRKGITLMQAGEKVDNYFNVKVGDKYEYRHGFPEPENPKKMDKDDWKVYFIKVTKFLRNYINETIIPKFVATDLNKMNEVATSEVVEVNNNDDLPF